MTVSLPESSQSAAGTVIAGGLVHGVHCVGYVVQEPDVPGNIVMANVKPLLDANA